MTVFFGLLTILITGGAVCAALYLIQLQAKTNVRADFVFLLLLTLVLISGGSTFAFIYLVTH